MLEVDAVIRPLELYVTLIIPASPTVSAATTSSNFELVTLRSNMCLVIIASSPIVVPSIEKNVLRSVVETTPVPSVSYLYRRIASAATAGAGAPIATAVTVYSPSSLTSK